MWECMAKDGADTVPIFALLALACGCTGLHYGIGILKFVVCLK